MANRELERLIELVEERQRDVAFMERLRRILERERAVLERLAKT